MNLRRNRTQNQRSATQTKRNNILSVDLMTFSNIRDCLCQIFDDNPCDGREEMERPFRAHTVSIGQFTLSEYRRSLACKEMSALLTTAVCL